jgi:hypothetical protein
MRTFTRMVKKSSLLLLLGGLLSLNIQAQTSVSGFSKSAVSPGDTVSIYGLGFTAVSQLRSPFYTGNFSTPYYSNSFLSKNDRRITFIVPANIPSNTPLTLSGTNGFTLTPPLPIVYETPTITGFLQNPILAGTQVSILGSGFGSVSSVRYKILVSGVNSTNTNTNIASQGRATNFWSWFTENLGVAGNITLTGGFGAVESPVLNYTYQTPSVTGLSVNPVVAVSNFSILGNNFLNVAQIAYNTIGGSVGLFSPSSNNSYASRYNILSAIAPNNIAPGTLTLTGSFGNVVTPYLNVSYTAPTFTGYSKSIVFPGDTISIYGDNLNSVVNIINQPAIIYTSLSPTILSRNDKRITYRVLANIAANATSTLTGGFGNLIIPPLAIQYETPTITGFVQDPTLAGTLVSILGSGFGSVYAIRYKNWSGEGNFTNPTSIFTASLGRATNVLNLFTYNTGVTGNLTFTGGFGSVESPIVNFIYQTPSVTGFSVNPVVVGSNFSILGNNFLNVAQIAYNTTGGSVGIFFPSSNNTYASRYNILSAIAPINIAPGTLTLTGSFGNVVTPYLNVSYITPTFTGYSKSIVFPGDTISIYGNSLNSVASIINQPATYYTTLSPTILSRNDKRITYRVLVNLNASATTTLTGGFGNLIIPPIAIQYETPTITGIIQNPALAGTIISVTGYGLGSVLTIRYRVWGNIGNNIGSYLGNFSRGETTNIWSTYTFNTGVTGNITLTGGFGAVEGPILNLTFLTPSVTGFSIDPVIAGSNFSILGNNFLNVAQIAYNKYNGSIGVFYQSGNTYASLHNIMSLVAPSDIASGTLTLTGSFGNVVTPYLNVYNPLQMNQTIAIESISDVTLSGNNQTVTISGSASSGLAVSYSIETNPSGIATLNGNFISLNNVGTVTLTGSQMGNANYLAATPRSILFNVFSFIGTNTNIATVSSLQVSNSLTNTLNSIKVTISGSNFAAGATATIGGVALTNISVIGNTFLVGIIPAGSTVSNPNRPSVVIQNLGSFASTSIEVTPTITGIFEGVSETVFIIYPNPNTGSFKVSSNSVISYQIYSLEGGLLQSGYLSEGENAITTKLGSGFYIFRVGNLSQKLLIE